MSEPLWCTIRQHYCRCHEYGKRCDEWEWDESVDTRDALSSAPLKAFKRLVESDMA